MAFTRAAPRTEFRYGSSPAASAMRPQRGSWETSTIGAYVCLSPTTADSRAPYLWSSKATRGSKLAPAPSGIGKMVRKPWMVSKANRIGIFSRDSSTAMRWSSRIRCGSVTLRTEPSPLRTSASVTMKSGSSWICSSFSWSVIFASRALTRRSTLPPAPDLAGRSACSSLDWVPATTPPAAAKTSARTGRTTEALNLNLRIGLLLVGDSPQGGRFRVGRLWASLPRRLKRQALDRGHHPTNRRLGWRRRRASGADATISAVTPRRQHGGQADRSLDDLLDRGRLGSAPSRHRSHVTPSTHRSGSGSLDSKLRFEAEVT